MTDVQAQVALAHRYETAKGLLRTALILMTYGENTQTWDQLGRDIEAFLREDMDNG